MSFIKVKDERLNFESVDDAKFAVYSAPKMNVSVIPPQNLPGVGAGVNYLSYLLNNVGPNVGRSKLLWVNLQASFNVVGTNLPTTADGYNSYVGFKCFPINRNVTSVQHVLNESTETYLTYQLIDWLSRLRQDADRIDFYENLYQEYLENHKLFSENNEFKELMLGMLRVIGSARYTIYDITNKFSKLKSIYVETDLEKEIADIINSEEHAYLDVKHQFLTESDCVPMSWQYV